MIGHFECTLNAGLNCKYIRSTSDFLRLHNRHRRNFIIIIRCWLCFAIAPADTFMCGRQNVFQLKSSWPFYLSLLFYIFFLFLFHFSACLFVWILRLHSSSLRRPPPPDLFGCIKLSAGTLHFSWTTFLCIQHTASEYTYILVLGA